MKKSTIFNWAYLSLLGSALFFAQGCGKDDEPELGLPELITLPVTEITQNAAKGGGNVSSDGGSPITSRGLCWSTDPNPTIANFTTNDGTGTGIFESEILALEKGTTYYVRAYAANSVGVAYGQQEEFTSGVMNANVYLVGSIKRNNEDIPVLIKNGDITIYENERGSLKAVFVKNSDVHMVSEYFVFGEEVSSTTSKYWKNGQVISQLNGINPFGRSLYVSNDNDVCIAGLQGLPLQGMPNFFNYQGVYWKNGTLYELAPAEHTSWASDITVDGNDVYVAGFIHESGGKRIATIWKNGNAQSITDGNKQAGLNSISIVNGNMYTAGFEGESVFSAQAKYWKNGVPIELPFGTSATDIKVIENDVYVGGYNDSDQPISMYWKNGVMTEVGPGYSGRMRVSSNGDVYMLVQPEGMSTNLYKNGEKVVYYDGEEIIELYDIYIVEE